MMNRRGDSALWSYIDVGLSISVPILFAIVGAGVIVAFEHAQRLSTIEALSYTKKEAKEDQKILTNAIAEMRETLHKIDKQTTTSAQSIEQVKVDVKELQSR